MYQCDCCGSSYEGYYCEECINEDADELTEEDMEDYYND